MAVGGGTPTVLPEAGLERLFDVVAIMGADLQAIPSSIEVSPATVTPEKVALVRDRGVRRVSVGIQSFETSETDAVFRPQPTRVVETALACLREAGFPSFNIDLVYGLPGQTAGSFTRSIERALDYDPTELYLYPLYVRPLTTLGKRGQPWSDERRELYERGRDHLLSRGFVQCSLRRFRAPLAPDGESGAYRCQEDGMVGLGAGARSYTRALHYSTRYGVAQSAVRAVIDDYLARTPADHARVTHGFVLDDQEQRRRYLILSLLERGVDSARYRETFGADPERDFPELGELVGAGLAQRVETGLELTAQGVTWSDTIGHWLFSRRVRELMAGYRAS
jgi:oxygen-independent coproporphyrinogen-3 oxidase